MKKQINFNKKESSPVDFGDHSSENETYLVNEGLRYPLLNRVGITSNDPKEKKLIKKAKKEFKKSFVSEPQTKKSEVFDCSLRIHFVNNRPKDHIGSRKNFHNTEFVKSICSDDIMSYVSSQVKRRKTKVSSVTVYTANKSFKISSDEIEKININ